MNLYLIIPSFYPATVYGGPIFSTLNTCKALAKLGMEVNVVTTNTNKFNRLDVAKNKWVDFPGGFQVKYYNETIVGFFSSALFLGIWQDVKRADCLHIQGIFNTPIPIALLAAFFFKKPVLLSPRGSFYPAALAHGSRMKKIWLKIFISFFARRVTWHATSDQERDDILQLYPGAQIALIPNGISLGEYEALNADKFYHQLLGRLGLTRENRPVIVSLSRIHKLKGLDVLIDAFRLVLDRFPQSLLLMAGADVGEMERLRLKIDKLGLTNRAIFVGELKGVEKMCFLKGADLFALPSHLENFGNAYLESLAAGTPIVASRNTPWSVVEERGCGAWVERTPGSFAEAIQRLLNEDQGELRSNSRMLASEFAWDNIAEKFFMIFESISNEHV